MTRARENKITLRVINEASGPIEEVAEAAEAAAEAVEDLNGRLRDSKGRFVKAGNSAETAGKKIRKAGDDAGNGHKNFKLTAGALATLKGPAVAAAAAASAVGAGFAFLAGKSVGTAAELEKFETQLGVLLGSAEKGKATVKELFEVSQKTPFEVGSIVEAETILEQFGVNAPKLRQGVMDLAATMNMDLAEAAGAVGKAMAGGAGAADILREKGVISMVSIQAGTDAAKMSQDQFRAALANTLATNQKLAGGTAKLATTFSGLMSTLRDQFSGFAKAVADAKLFSTVKATLTVVLDLLKENKSNVGDLAAELGGNLASGLVRLVDLTFKFAALVQRVREGWLTIVQVIEVLKIALAEFALSAMENLTKIPLVGPKIRDSIGGAMSSVESEIGRMNRELSETANKVDAARASQMKLLQTGDQTVTKIRELAGAYQQAADASSGVTLEKSDALMRQSVPGQGAKGGDGMAAAAKETAKFFEGLKKQASAAAKSAQALTIAQRGTQKESDKLAQKQNELRKELQNAATTADELGVSLDGPEFKAHVANVQTQIRQIELVRQSALKKEADAAKEAAQASIDKAAADAQAAQQAKQQKVAAAAGVAGDALQATAGGGGLENMLGMAGPWGAVAGAAIGIGRGASEQRDAAIAEIAQEKAGERQQAMQEQRDSLLAAGATEEQLAAQGLGEADIEKAGEVTEEDIAKAEGLAPSTESFIADQVENMVRGLIEGVKGIILALPDILVELIPPLITEFIPALIEAVIKMIPKLVRAIFVELPTKIFQGLTKWWRVIWSAIKDLFSFGFATGTPYVPADGRYLLHQGERILPASGTQTGTARQGLGAFMGGGHTINVSAAVVDNDSIPALGRLINQELGEFGRLSFPVFNS